MTIDRRRLLLGSLSSAAVFATPARAAPTQPQGLNATQFGVRPNTTEDQSQRLQRAIDQAARANKPLWLPPGRYRAGDLKLRAGSQLTGVRGATHMALTRGPSLLSAEGAAAITLSGLMLDGGNRPLASDGGLIHLTAVSALRVVDCTLTGASGNGIALYQCDGEIARNSIAGATESALFSNDSHGLIVSGNIISDCGNGGILVWQSEKRSDRSVIAGNHIDNTAARSGGSGQNGNAINVYRAANVTVRNNVIRGAAFSAIRGNSASHIQIIGNNCVDLGEVAIYSEFEFEDAIIADNVIDQAGTGISVTNFKEGGRLASVRGNVIRNISSRRPGAAPEDGGVGISVEADTSVTGNVIENAQTAGISAGWGPYLRDVTVSKNVVRQCGVGVAVSVVKGAGRATIADNLLAGSQRGAIVGMEWHKAVTGDLALAGAEHYPHLKLSGNRTG